MATPKPGEIRCPTCHRSTPPASFCTQCGSAIPSDARIRPRGMDRDELQDRIRARRSGGEPFRRGSSEDERGGYERYEPDPIDARARRARGGSQTRHDFLQEGRSPETAAGGSGIGTGDLTRDRDEWARPAAAAAPASMPPPAEPYAPPPSDVPLSEPEIDEIEEPAAYAAPSDEDPQYEDHFDDDADYDESGYPYRYDEWDEQRERRSGTGALAIVGFLGLGVLALLGGALLAGLFDGGPTAGIGDATPSPTATVEPTVAPTPSPTADGGSPGASGSPPASGEPVVFPDGFTAEAQPCLPGSAGNDGCDSNASTNGGAVDIWVGFSNGNGDDVIGATLIAPDGTRVDGSIDLADIDCGASCNGYTWFPFSGLAEGTYEVRVTRNGELAAVTTFEVS